MPRTRPLVEPSPGVRVDVLGVRVSAITLPQAVATLSGWVDRRERHYVCVTGVHGVMECQGDAGLRDIHNNSGLTTPDGMPLVWAGRWAGVTGMSRVYGPDLLLAMCEESQRRGWRPYFYGAGEGVAERLVARLEERFPHLDVAGWHTPPFREAGAPEDQAVIDAINASGADIVWVGLSTPKQERWMAAHISRLEAAVLVGVGAAFDIHAGVVPQAPAWMQRSGMEWVYRLMREPKRLWRRYLGNNPRFVAAIVRRQPRVVMAENR